VWYYCCVSLDFIRLDCSLGQESYHGEAQNPVLFHFRAGERCVLFQHVFAIFFVAEASFLVTVNGEAQQIAFFLHLKECKSNT
jgi:hypothetical protein